MKTSRCFALWLVAAFAAACLPGSLPAQDAVKPAHFRDLLAVGDAVYLQTSADSLYHSVQLLSEEQTAAVRKVNAQIAKLRERIAGVAQKLTMEQRLEQRATLILEIDKLESELARARRSRAIGATYYEVTHIGDDYVALKNEDDETFVPFRSIRSIRTTLRGGELPASRSVSREGRTASSGFRGGSGFGGRGDYGEGGFGRGGFGGRPAQAGMSMRLQYLKAAEVAEVVKKLFAEQKPNVEIDESNNELSFTADTETVVSIRRLLQSLDTKPE